MSDDISGICCFVCVTACYEVCAGACFDFMSIRMSRSVSSKTKCSHANVGHTFTQCFWPQREDELDEQDYAEDERRPLIVAQAVHVHNMALPDTSTQALAEYAADSSPRGK